MKITKSSKEVALFAAMKFAANLGCNVCPCCGETKSYGNYMKEGILNRGIMAGLHSKTWVKGIFHMKNMQCDCYKCYSCGAEWESEPYQTNPKIVWRNYATESTQSFSVTKYLGRIEEECVRLSMVKPDDYILVLWAGQDGLKLNKDGSMEWVKKSKYTEECLRECSREKKVIQHIWKNGLKDDVTELCMNDDGTICGIKRQYIRGSWR